MAEGNLLVEVKKLRANARFGKKKHFNASGRKSIYQTKINIPVIVMNITVGTSLFAIFNNKIPEVWGYVSAAIAWLSAILVGLGEHFKFGEQSESHNSIGNRYLNFIRDCDLVIADYQDGIINDSQLSQSLKSLASELGQIDAYAGKYTTNNDDYKKAQEGINAGEEEYTETDLK